MSTSPQIKLPPGATLETAAPPAVMKLPPGAQLETAPPPAAEQPGWLDREIPITSHAAATMSGVQSVARGTRDAIKGTLQLFDPRPQNDEEKAVAMQAPGGIQGGGHAMLPVYRILRSIGHTASDATQLAATLHDINNSPDPVGTYLKVGQETAGQGAGQALTALATEGLGRVAGAATKAIVESPKAAATAPVRLVARTAETALNQKLIPLKKLANLNTPADAAEALEVKVPGRDFGLEKPAPKPTPELDATGENKPFAGGLDEPPPQKTLDATGENKPFAGGMDEYTGPKPKRTVVTDPATGRPEFSDVVAARRPAAPQPAAAAPEAPAAAQAPPEAAQAPQVAQSPAPAAQAPPAAEPAPAAEPGPSGEDLLERLRGIAGRIQKQEAAAPGAAEPDLIQQMQDSIDLVKARKAVAAAKASPGAAVATGTATEPAPGVMTTAAPKDLLGRWGVDEESFAQGREQTRGMKPDESAAAIAKLKKAYQNGQAVEPVMETRDAANNIIEVDGRGRALAAHQAGIERIPIIVRRMKPTPATAPVPQ